MPEADAVELQDDDIVYRRYFRRKKHIPSTAFCKPRSNPSEPDPEISVDLARLTTPEKTLQNGPNGMKIAVLKVGEIKRLGFTIRPQHDDDNDNEAHCVICGVQTLDHCDLLTEIAIPLEEYEKQNQLPNIVQGE